MPLTDWQIADRVADGTLAIDPFVGHKVKNNGYPVISYGLSSFGYDVRLAGEIKIFVPMPNVFVQPKQFDTRCLVDVSPIFSEANPSEQWVIMPPHSFLLGYSVEYFEIPKDVICTVVGKSTYARCGLILNVTPLEPGWKGHITLELSNTTPAPAQVFLGEGIGQVLFYQGEAPHNGYGDGKYQDQGRQITLPKV